MEQVIKKCKYFSESKSTLAAIVVIDKVQTSDKAHMLPYTQDVV